MLVCFGQGLNGSCEEPIYSTGKLCKKKLCNGHYQREYFAWKRGLEICDLGPIRHYEKREKERVESPERNEARLMIQDIILKTEKILRRKSCQRQPDMILFENSNIKESLALRDRGWKGYLRIVNYRKDIVKKIEASIKRYKLSKVDVELASLFRLNAQDFAPNTILNIDIQSGFSDKMVKFVKDFVKTGPKVLRMSIINKDYFRSKIKDQNLSAGKFFVREMRNQGIQVSSLQILDRCGYNNKSPRFDEVICIVEVV